MRCLSVLLVDDSRDFMDSASRFLCREGHIKVVGCAVSGVEALSQVEVLHPDLVLMDVAMPQMTGLEATRLLKAGADPPCIVIVALHDLPEYREAAAAASADGYITKSGFCCDLLPLVDKLLAHPSITDQ